MEEVAELIRRREIYREIGMDTQFPQIPKSPKVHNPANQQIKKCAEKSTRKEEIIGYPQDIHTINQYRYVYTS